MGPKRWRRRRGLILVNSQGFALWRCFGALYFEELRGLMLMNSRGFAFWSRSGALYFEDLKGLIHEDSRGFAFCIYMYIYIYTSTIYIISYVRDSIFRKSMPPDVASCVFLRFSGFIEPFPVKTRGFVLWRPVFLRGPGARIHLYLSSRGPNGEPNPREFTRDCALEL